LVHYWVCPKSTLQFCPGLLYQENNSRSVLSTSHAPRVTDRGQPCLREEVEVVSRPKRYSMDAVDENRNRKRVNDLEVLESLHGGERFPHDRGSSPLLGFVQRGLPSTAQVYFIKKTTPAPFRPHYTLRESLIEGSRACEKKSKLSLAQKIFNGRGGRESKQGTN
ncbi:hypothetical protein CDAR_164121, partial [Caerostris darwini]